MSYSKNFRHYFANMSYGFVERFEGVGYDRKVIQKGDDNFLTLAEYEEKMNIKKPEVVPNVPKVQKRKQKKVVIDPMLLGFKDYRKK